MRERLLQRIVTGGEFSHSHLATKRGQLKISHAFLERFLFISILVCLMHKL